MMRGATLENFCSGTCDQFCRLVILIPKLIFFLQRIVELSGSLLVLVIYKPGMKGDRLKRVLALASHLAGIFTTTQGA
jgi:hypothetical protein